jgi:hypothetical protein
VFADYSGSHYPTSVPTAFIPAPVRDMPGGQQSDRILFPGRGRAYQGRESQSYTAISRVYSSAIDDRLKPFGLFLRLVGNGNLRMLVPESDRQDNPQCLLVRTCDYFCPFYPSPLLSRISPYIQSISIFSHPLTANAKIFIRSLRFLCLS